MLPSKSPFFLLCRFSFEVRDKCSPPVKARKEVGAHFTNVGVVERDKSYFTDQTGKLKDT